jgi:hypothetical protein
MGVLATDFRDVRAEVLPCLMKVPYLVLGLLLELKLNPFVLSALS